MTGLDAIVGARELTTPADMHAFGVEIGRMLSAGDLVGTISRGAAGRKTRSSMIVTIEP